MHVTINYLFEGDAHVYLPDAIGQLQGGSLLIAEAGLEQEKRRERNQAKAEAARKVAERLLGWDRSHLAQLKQSMKMSHGLQSHCNQQCLPDNNWSAHQFGLCGSTS